MDSDDIVEEFSEPEHVQVKQEPPPLYENEEEYDWTCMWVVKQPENWSSVINKIKYKPIFKQIMPK